MKLVFCPDCRDVLRLILEKWRLCKCGRSGGQYHADGLSATVGGAALVFGIPNPFFWGRGKAWLLLSPDERKWVRQLWKDQETDIWWGPEEGPGTHIARIASPKGPRVKSWPWEKVAARQGRKRKAMAPSKWSSQGKHR